jgi:hypothetical protein
LHLSNAGFCPHHPPSRLLAIYEQKFYFLKLSVDNSSLGKVLHIPSTLMIHGGCPQTSLFPNLLVYHYLVYLDGWSENVFSKIFFLHSDKELASIPSSVGSFNLVYYLSRLWETMLVVYTGCITFFLS